MSIDHIPLPRTDGTLWLCGLRDVAPDPEAALAYADGASTIVCLNPVGELQVRYPAYVEWLRAHAAGAAIWFPVTNFDAPDATRVMPILERVVTRLEAGEGVLMHCAMGQGRAGTMAVCLLLVLGADEQSALRTVAANRAFAGPGSSSQWALVEAVGRMVRAT